MTAYLKERHDIGIVNVGTDGTGTAETGIMLVRENNAPVFAEFDGSYLVDQLMTSVPSQDYTNPEQEIILYQNDFRKGFGQYIQDSSQEYYSSYGMDLRFKNGVTLSYGATSITPPEFIVARTIINGDMELLTGWTGGVGRDNTKAHAGTYSWKCGGATTTATQTLADWSNNFRLTVFKIQCYVWCATDNGTISIYDGVDTTTSSTQGGTSDWALLTVTHRFNAAATELTIKLNSTSGQDVWFDDCTKVYEPLTAAVKKGIDFNSVHYIPVGNILMKMSGGGTSFSAVYSFPANITDLKVFGVSGTDYLFIAIGLANAYWYMTAAEAFTESTAAVKFFEFFQPVYTTALTMYGNDSNSTIRSTINPLNGGTAWSAQTQVDSDLYDITGLYSHSGALYKGKENRPFYLSSAGAVQNDLAPECESSVTTTSGKNGDIWLGKFYYPYGTQYLLEIGDTNTRRTPADYCTNLSDFTGLVSAVTHDGDQWLIVCLNNTTKVEVLMCRLENIDGTDTWVVHPYRELTMGNCNTAWVSSIFQKRVWIASATSNEALQYIPLPAGYGDLVSDANRSFATGGYFETSFLHGNFPGDKKAYIKMTMELGHAYDTNIYFTAAYKKIEDSSYTSIGNFKGTSSSRLASLYIPIDSGTLKPTSTMMQFKITGVTNDTTKTPIMLNYKVSAVLYPTIRRKIYCKILCAEEMTNRNGLLEKNRADVITTIDNLRTATYPVTMHDINGTARTVKYMPLPSNMPKYQIIRDEKGREKERHYNVILQEIVTS